MSMHLPKELPSLRDLLEASGIRSAPPASHLDAVAGISVFAAGLLVGAGLGLLFAPSAGTTLRRQIGDRVNAGVTDLRERVDTARGQRPEDRDAKSGTV